MYILSRSRGQFALFVQLLGHGSDPLCLLFDFDRLAAPVRLKLPHRSLGGQIAAENTETTINRQ